MGARLLPLPKKEKEKKKTSPGRCHRLSSDRISSPSTNYSHPLLTINHRPRHQVVPSGCRAMIGHVTGGRRTDQKPMLKAENANHQFSSG
ncbi:hypothetical protein Taro_048321 [Colocasia esculenta]|uniref:Uncharacterized protein n=1 Tax=Colocasia esculenta TaxID=4460 RepID=A0A843X7D2_COLES|nr:hypothetical protein [Colocasia esculenta]